MKRGERDSVLCTVLWEGKLTNGGSSAMSEPGRQGCPDHMVRLLGCKEGQSRGVGMDHGQCGAMLGFKASSDNPSGKWTAGRALTSSESPPSARRP